MKKRYFFLFFVAEPSFVAAKEVSKTRIDGQYYGLPDPFSRPRFNTDNQNNRKKTELETFPVRSLKVNTILKGFNGSYAMISDPRGKSHVLRKGTLVGLNNGVVEEIKRDQVLISEKFVGLTGQVQTFTTQLMIEGEDLLMETLEESLSNDPKNAPNLPPPDKNITDALLKKLMSDPTEKLLDKSLLTEPLPSMMPPKTQIPSPPKKEEDANALEFMEN
jgi:hypothetical protein